MFTPNQLPTNSRHFHFRFQCAGVDAQPLRQPLKKGVC